MEKQDTKTDDGCSVIKLSDSSYSIIKNKIIYKLNLTLKERTIDFNIRMQMAPNSYEGIFTMDDFCTISRLFFFFDRLDDIYQSILGKIEEEEINLIEDKDFLILKFFFSIEKRNQEIKLKLNKNQDTDLHLVMNDMCKTILMLLETTKRLEEKQKNIDNVELFKSIINSKVVKEEEIKMIKEWVNDSYPDLVEFELLYRSSVNGKSARDFHIKCDNKGSTITFVKTTDGKRFGGFTTLNWESHGGYYKGNDYNSFLFSLDKKKKLKCNDQNYVIYTHYTYGPSFGNGHDIYISGGHVPNCYDNTPHAFGKNEGISQYFLAGKHVFVPEEVEVYSVK